MQEEKKCVFDEFTNLYELSKTLRFELKPVGKTKQLLDEQRVFLKDKKVLENYRIVKKYFDKLHKKFVKDALKDTNLEFKEYKKAYFDYVKKSKDDRKKEFIELEKKEANLRKKIKKLFDDCAKNWKEKYNSVGVITKKDDLNILFEKETLNILRYEFKANEYPDVEYLDEKGEKKNIFESFRGFTTYFTNFHNSRKNFYEDNGIASAIPTRIINDNLRKFIENNEAYSHIQHKLEFTDKEKNIFEINYYNKYFLQAGIDKYNETISKINSKVNEFRQKNKEKIPFFKILFKQILEDSKKQEIGQDDFIEISENKEVFEVLKQFIKHNENNNKIFKTIFDDFFNNQDKYELDKIYLANRFINTISNKWFSGWELFDGLILEKMNEGKPKLKQKMKLPEFIPFSQIKESLEENEIKVEDLFKKDVLNKEGNNNKNVFDVFMAVWKNEFDDNMEKYRKALTCVNMMIDTDKEYTNKKEQKDEKNIEIQKEKIKDYADSALAIYQMMKYFALEKGKKNLESLYEIDANFYNKYNIIINEAKTWLYYNEFRNYLTKKPFNEDKVKLNFENGTLLGGWDKNKEKDNYGVILKKDNKYYLGLVLKKSNNIFEEKFKQDMNNGLENGHYKKMFYKYSKDVSLGIPKSSTQTKEVVSHFAASNKDFYVTKGSSVGKFIEPLKITQEIFELNNRIYKKDNLATSVLRGQIDKDKEKEYIKIFQKEYVKLGGNLQKHKEAVYKWVEFCKEFLSVYPSSKFFNYSSLKNTKEYNSLDEFYADVDARSYCVAFNEKVSDKYIDEKINTGELYLFEIYNKDFSKKSTGNKNLHTIYFENIFSEENIKNTIIKLNGQAEIFFREKSIDKEIKEKKKTHDIIKNNRYTEDKILFHCPIKLNFSKDDKRINLKVNEVLAVNKDIKILGIDRGEKHLAYYSVIDQAGKIIDIGSLNKIKAGNKEIDYLAKLDEKEKSIDNQQKSWQSIENIKELKQGYISQIVKKICDLAIKHNAIIIFEDLNSGFKRGRQKIKKQIYQKLELALVNKLNYLVNKNEERGKAGHFLSAYQLAQKVDNFKDIGKQTGIIFYTQASYTSTTCPECGFRKNLYLKYSTIEKAQEIFKNLEIYYEYDKDRFAVKYNPKRFKDLKFLREEYVIYSDGIRLYWNNKKKITEPYNLNELFKKIFADKIDILGDISKQINAERFDAKFYKDLIFYINLILQLRNSDSVKGFDYIICPVCGFHSDNGFQGEKFNGDANGAYNIARKGIMVLDKINKFKKDKDDLSKLKWKDLTVKIEDWDQFTQK